MLYLEMPPNPSTGLNGKHYIQIPNEFMKIFSEHKNSIVSLYEAYYENYINPQVLNINPMAHQIIPGRLYPCFFKYKPSYYYFLDANLAEKLIYIWECNPNRYIMGSENDFALFKGNYKRLIKESKIKYLL